MGYCNVKGTEFVETFRKNHCLNFVTSQKYALTLIFVTLKVTQISQCCFFSCGVEIIKSLLDKGMSVNWTDAHFLLRYIFSPANGNLEKTTFRVTQFQIQRNNISISVYDCTVEDVEYIYNKLSIHIQQQNYSHRLNLL